MKKGMVRASELTTTWQDRVVVERYKIKECVRVRGKVAEFWASDVTEDRDVLLKTVPDPDALDDVVREKFKREAIALRQFEHPNTLQLLNARMDGERPVLVFEAPRGRIASRALRDGATWSVPKSLEMAHTLIETLALLHLRGWVHRDVRPSNLWLEPSEGQIKLMLAGFGLCGPPGSTNLQGAVSHIAPELLRGSKASTTSDVYALGMTLYELFTGEPALEAKSPESMMRAHMNNSPKPLDRVVPEYGEQSPGMVMLIHECIDRNPNIRPRDAADVLERMGALVPSTSGAEALSSPDASQEEMLTATASGNAREWSRDEDSDMYVNTAGGLSQFNTDEFVAKPGGVWRKAERLRKPDEG